MPQATAELRKKWHYGKDGEWPADKQAYDYLKDRSWSYDKGVWRKPNPDYRPTEAEWSALDYLIQEWDEAFEPT